MIDYITLKEIQAIISAKGPWLPPAEVAAKIFNETESWFSSTWWTS